MGIGLFYIFCKELYVDNFSTFSGNLAWMPARNNFKQWLLIDLKEPHLLKSIATQGRSYSRGDYVSGYFLFYSRDGQGFWPYKNSDGLKQVQDW